MCLYAEGTLFGIFKAITDVFIFQNLISAHFPWELTWVTNSDANGTPVRGQHSCWFFIRTPISGFSAGAFVLAEDDK